MVVRDIDLLKEISKQNHISVSFTVTTLNADLARILEPRAPRPDLRLDALRSLRDAGVRAGVICAPVLPGVTDSPKQLEAVVKAAAENKAVHIYANPLFLKPCSAAVFLPFLKEHFPKLVPEYEKRFKDRAFLPAAYRKRISGLMAQLKEKYGIRDDSRWSTARPAEEHETQLALF
jgi:DNA repair photolyase